MLRGRSALVARQVPPAKQVQPGYKAILGLVARRDLPDQKGRQVRLVQLAKQAFLGQQARLAQQDLAALQARPDLPGQLV